MQDTARPMIAFALASSGCYVLNDLRDRAADQSHPRKRSRPIASGAVSPSAAKAWAAALLLAAALASALAAIQLLPDGGWRFAPRDRWTWLACTPCLLHGISPTLRPWSGR